MISKKLAKGTNRQFILIDSKAQFDKLNIQTDEQTSQEQKKQKAQQQIIIPKTIISESKQRKTREKIPRSYIKTISIPPQMNPLAYQIDQLDHNFLTQKLPFLSAEQFSMLIVALEKCANKFCGVQFNYHGLLTRKFMKMGIQTKFINYKQKEQDNEKQIKFYDRFQDNMQINVKEVSRLIYVYWRNKRKNMRSPLLRQYWMKSVMGPYKHRQECQGLQLRNRMIKVEDEVIRGILKQDAEKLKKLLTQMKKRELIELQLLKNQQIIFEKQCKKVISLLQSEKINKKQSSSYDSDTYCITTRKQKLKILPFPSQSKQKRKCTSREVPKMKK